MRKIIGRLLGVTRGAEPIMKHNTHENFFPVTIVRVDQITRLERVKAELRDITTCLRNGIGGGGCTGTVEEKQ